MSKEIKNDDKKIIASRIRLAIEESTYNPTEIAVMCDASRQAVNNWMNNGRIAKHRLVQLANITGRDFNWFLGIENSHKNQNDRDNAFKIIENIFTGKSTEDVEKLAHALELIAEVISNKKIKRKTVNSQETSEQEYQFKTPKTSKKIKSA